MAAKRLQTIDAANHQPCFTSAVRLPHLFTLQDSLRVQHAYDVAAGSTRGSYRLFSIIITTALTLLLKDNNFISCYCYKE